MPAGAYGKAQDIAHAAGIERAAQLAYSTSLVQPVIQASRSLPRKSLAWAFSHSITAMSPSARRDLQLAGQRGELRGNSARCLASFGQPFGDGREVAFVR